MAQGHMCHMTKCARAVTLSATKILLNLIGFCSLLPSLANIVLLAFLLLFKAVDEVYPLV